MIDAAGLARAVHDAVLGAACTVRPDALAAMRAALEREKSERGRGVLAQLVKNAGIGASERVPICQDTGSVWVRIELGDEEAAPRGLQAAIDAAIADAFREGALRMSMARDALFDRSNTGDNTPAFVDLVLRPGRGARVHVMLKGGGSDNASALEMLPPSAGEAGVAELVVRTVREKATGACPPLVIGVGVGATFDKVASLAKTALLREIGSPNPDPRAAAFEATLLAAVNATGIGPAGLGGDTTALAVHVLTAPSHIAALPVAVNMGCCAVRSVSVDVD